MPGQYLDLFRFNLGAYINGTRASGMEPASGRWTDRARDFTRKNDSRRLVFGIRNRNSRHQSNSVRMKWILEQLLRLSNFHQFPEIHDSYSIANVSYSAEIVRDVEVC